MKEAIFLIFILSLIGLYNYYILFRPTRKYDNPSLLNYEQDPLIEKIEGYSYLLSKVWNSKDYKDGNNLFFLANYGFFRFVDKEEFIEFNLQKNKEYKIPKDFEDSYIISVADLTDGDGVPSHYLVSDLSNRIYIVYLELYDIWKPVFFANSLDEIFEFSGTGDLRICENKEDLWYWSEDVFHSDRICNNFPLGVYPKLDMRSLFIKIKGTYINSHQEFCITEFIKYFKQYNIMDEIPKDFAVFNYYDEELISLIEIINSKHSNTNFKIVSFDPSAYWGVINIKEQNNSTLNELIRLGILDNNY